MQPGDVVMLRCGGPKMVISHADEPPKAIPGVDILGPPWRPGWVCLWTVQNALRSAAIPEDALRAAKPD
jgi:uncharacterized protein YodC (DUF2158 family)